MQLNREGTKTSSSDVCAPNLSGDSITDEDLIRAFILALAAGGRKPKTLTVYQESVRSLSAFAGCQQPMMHRRSETAKRS